MENFGTFFDFISLIMNSMAMKKDKSGSAKKTGKRSLFYRILRTGFLIFFIFLIVTTIFVTIISLSRPFRSYIVSKALTLANNELTAKVELEDLRIAMFRGIRLSNVRLIAAGDTIVYSPEIIVDFNLEALLASKVRVSYLKIQNPVIKLLRSKDSTWNYDHIAPPSNDTTNSGPSKWTILVKKAILENAKFTMYDSLAQDSSLQKFSPARIFTDNMNFNFSADIKPGKHIFDVNIDELKLLEKRSGIDLTHLGVDIAISSQKFGFKSLDMETNLGNLDGDLEITNFNPFDSTANSNFNKAVLTGDISGKDIQMNLPDKFTKLPEFFDRNFKSDIKADFSGSLENMNIKSVVTEFSAGVIKISGNIKRLDESDSLQFNTNLDGTKLPYGIIKSFISPDEVKSIPVFEKITFDKTIIKGNTKFLSANLDINSDLAVLKGTAEVDLRSSETPKFKGKLDAETLNLGKISNDTNLTGSINSKIDFDFENTDYKKINGFAVLNVYDSYIKTGGKIYRFKTIDLSAKAKSGHISIDSSNIVLKVGEEEADNTTLPQITISGDIDLNQHDPQYKLFANLKSVDFYDLLNNPDFPQSFSGSVHAEGKGFNIDSLQTNFKLSVDEILFKDRYINPFTLNATLSEPNSDTRQINITSELANISISGNFKIADMAKTFANSGILTADFIMRHLNPALKHISDNPEQTDTFRLFKPENNEFHEGYGDIRCEVKDLSLVNAFIDGVDLFSETSFEMHFESDKKGLRVRVDSLDINYLDIYTKGSSIKFQPLRISLNYEITPDSILPEIRNMNIKIADSGKFYVNDLLLEYYPTGVSFVNDSMNFYSGIEINNELNAQCSGSASIGNGFFNLQIDSAAIKFPDSIAFKTKYPAKFAISDTGGINVTQFTVEREGSENYSVSGIIKNFTADDLKVSMHDFSIQGLFPFIPGEELKDKLSTLSGNYKKLDLVANGPLNEPVATLDAEIDSLSYNTVVLGDLIANLNYKDKNLVGNISLMSAMNKEDALFTAKIVKMPLNIGLNQDEQGFFKNKDTRIELYGKSLPLRAAEPFIPNVANVFGKAEIDATITGQMPDNLDYNGNLRVNYAEFLLTSTNITYRTEASISFNNNKFSIDTVKLKNVPSDIELGGGNAFIHGSLVLDGTEIQDLDLKITADRLLGLSDASIATMPDLYGDVIFSCSKDGLRFFGNLQEPNLQGSLTLNKADIKMLQPKNRLILQTRLKYTIDSGSNKVIINIRKNLVDADSLEEANKNTNDGKPDYSQLPNSNTNTQQQAKNKPKAQPNIADLINYDLFISFANPIKVSMDMGFASTYSVLGLENNRALHYVRNRDNPQQASVTGPAIELRDQSTLKLLKTLNTTGKISFPTGNIQNPTLDLTATYNGVLRENGQRNKYQVIITITGPKDNPQLNMTYTIAGESAVGDKNRIQEDAMYLLLTGSRKGSPGSSVNSSLVQEGLDAGLSQGSSTILNSFFSGTNIIQNADVAVKSDAFEESTFQLSGAVGNVIWTIGGSLGDFQNNNEITLEVPMNEFIESSFWDNFVFQFTKSTSSNGTIITNDAKLWELKLKFGNSF